MLELKSVSKDYEGFKAVQNLELHVPAGEFFCFLGPNGAGKTTTIKMITGLLRPSKGAVSIGGLDIQKDPVAAKHLVGYIPDTPYLYEKLTGREFLHFIGDLYQVPRERQEEALNEYFSRFLLMSSADKLIENYSHGMRQKLCFSVALMHQPKLLVVDEPMIGLDPRSARTLKDLLLNFCADGGAIFLSTHILAIAEELADRIGIISKGELRFLGKTDELRRQLERDGNLEDLVLQLTEEAAEEEINANLANPLGSPKTVEA